MNETANKMQAFISSDSELFFFFGGVCVTKSRKGSRLRR